MKNGTWRLETHTRSGHTGAAHSANPLHQLVHDDGRERKTTSKIAHLSSARPVLPKRLPPYVLAVRLDLRVFLRLWIRRNTQITATTSTNGGSLLGKTSLALERGEIVVSFSCCRQPSIPRPQTAKGTPNQHPGPQKDPQPATFHPKTPN